MTFIPRTAQKLIWNPEDSGQNGSARVITTDARHKEDSQSLPANRQMLIIAALVTESPQPVMEPIRIQNRQWTAKALLRFNLKALSTMGRQTRKPEK